MKKYIYGKGPVYNREVWYTTSPEILSRKTLCYDTKHPGTETRYRSGAYKSPVRRWLYRIGITLIFPFMPLIHVLIFGIQKTTWEDMKDLPSTYMRAFIQGGPLMW